MSPIIYMFINLFSFIVLTTVFILNLRLEKRLKKEAELIKDYYFRSIETTKDLNSILTKIEEQSGEKNV